MRAVYQSRCEVVYHVGAAEPPAPTSKATTNADAQLPSPSSGSAGNDEEAAQWKRLQDFLGRANSNRRCKNSVTNYLCLHGPAVKMTMELLPDFTTGRPSLPGEIFPVSGHSTLEPGTRVDVLSTDTNTVLTGTLSRRDSSGGADIDVMFDSGATFSIIPGQTQFAIRDYSGYESTLPKMEAGSEIDALDCCGTQCCKTAAVDACVCH